MFSKREARKNLDYAQDRSRELSDDVCEGVKSAASHSCAYLKENPWAGVGVGAALGFIVGVLISKK
ncbi:membrane protein [[Pantoea] beijingensis]|uniref:Membrane protein n=1 Tax=[Pantoea] beijingensis TaxID=1324864 RepID=A0A443ICL2_9GAMM|nr:MULTISPECIES: DUF883 family protein [Erwiniaceae]RWR01859.1 membrane protein [[Pantoea] beijingensis]